MSLLLLSFFAGILTVLAPCVFTLLPIIIGGSASSKNRFRPYVVTASLAISLLLFTILLKVTTVFLNVNPIVWTYLSGVLIIALGLVSLFPKVWDSINVKLGFSGQSDHLLNSATQKDGIGGAVLTGAALGPVFSSCSPTYAFALSSVLSGNFQTGLVNILAYILGLSLVMLAISLLGQRLIKRLRWAVNPDGIFKKIVGVLFLIVGLSIIFGLDKKVENYFIALDPFHTLSAEQKLLQKAQPTSNSSNSSSELLNVNPPTQAPELTGIDSWINSNGETIAGLKGKVVLVDFWTYSCINCQRNLPYITKLYDTYKDQGFVVLGIHAPEFAFEKKRENVVNATKEFKINYPVGLDNNFDTWNAYHNQSWPAEYLIDKNGQLRRTHFGEGEYAQTETAIRALLQENGTVLPSTLATSTVDTGMKSTNLQTPETYLGWSQAKMFQSSVMTKYNEPETYILPDKLNTNSWGLSGLWTINNSEIISDQDGSKLKLQFSAKEVYIVAGSDQSAQISITLNGKKLDSSNKGENVDDQSNVKMQPDQLYKLIKLNSFTSNQELEMTVPKGVRLNVFTFGS